MAELLQAEEALLLFLHALESNDEGTMLELLYDPDGEWREIAAGSGREGLLASLGLELSEMGDLGVVHTARLLTTDDERPPLVAFGFLRGGGEPQRGDGGQLIHGPTAAHVLALTPVDGEWRIWGPPDASDFAEAELVRLPMRAALREQMLSVLATEWTLALEPHLDALARLREPATRDDVFVGAPERAHSIASIAMLVFAIESLGARLVASGRLAGTIPGSLLDSVADLDDRQELAELFVLRNLLTHNHVWRMSVTVGEDWGSVVLDDAEHLYGDDERRSYATAIDPGARRTKRLGLNVVPTSIRRADAGIALRVAVRSFDHLAALDVPRMRSLADQILRINGSATRLRDLEAELVID